MTKPPYQGERMEVPSELQGIYTHFYFAQNDSDQVLEFTFVPSFQVMLIFSLGTPISLMIRDQPEVVIERYFILGPVKQAFNYRLPPGANVVVVNFANDGFHRLFGAATAQSSRLEQLDEDCFSAIHRALQQQDSAAQQRDLLLVVGKDYLQSSARIELDTQEMVNQSVHEQALLKETHARTLQMHYKNRLGYSVKEYTRYHRFMQMITLVQESLANQREVDWADVVFTCGYYDQSHLIRDFKHYLMMSPSQYLKLSQQMCTSR